MKEKHKLGRGSVAYVFRATLRIRVKGKADEWKEVACKVLQGDIARNPKAVALFGKEVGVLCHLKHPNICKAYGGWTTLNEDGDNDIYPTLVLELLPYSLAGLLWPNASSNAPQLTEGQIIVILRQLIEVLAFLNNRCPQIVHRDVKPENILLTLELIPKLCDFGIAKEYGSSLRKTYGTSTTTANGIRGTAAYIVCQLLLS